MSTSDVEKQPHTPWETAAARIADDHAVVLWKTDCEFSAQLISELRDDPALTWVNIYEDETTRAKTRELNDGNELTPTVIVGKQVLRNPSADELRSMLHG